MLELYLATQNPHKVAELQKLIGSTAVLHSIPKDLQLPEETGTTFKENAFIKARFVAKTLGVHALADDSGLSVQVLDNAPGVYAAVFAGPQATDDENRQKLIDSLKSKGVEESPAFFTCLLALVSPSLGEHTFTGEIHGKVSVHLAGNKGFAYDPMFTPNGHNQTFAEMTQEAKGAISHRYLAAQKLIHFLK